MFCILLANLRKQVKTPYNLLDVNEDFLDIASLKLHHFIHLSQSEGDFGVTLLSI